MATLAPQPTEATILSHTLLALASAEGSAAHGYVNANDGLFGGRHEARNAADAVHHLCLLHGRHPGVIDHAGNHTTEVPARSWMIAAIEGFALERALLAKLVVAAGPLPSTPGQAETESAVISQRHALDMLAQSDRRGCAFGAAAALVMDWHAVRTVIDHAAKRFSIEAPACKLPGITQTLDVVASAADGPAVARAITFGVQQLYGQHRGLWDLLEARQIARGDQ